MPRALGLMNPDNAVKSAGAFKEGYVRIDSNSYKVHKGKDGDTEPAIPATKWSWNVTRMNEAGDEPLTDEHDSPITEELLFSFGGKCLPFIHPGKADSVDDDDVEDLGIDLTPEHELGGNTVYLNAPDWRPNEKSSLMMLTRSMAKLNVKADFLNRCWAPDWNGCVFYLKSEAGEKGKDGRSFNYKVASKILVGPGSKTAKAKGSKASTNGDSASDIAAPILMAISKELDGQQITRKAFLNRVKAALEATKVDAKLLIPVLTICKDDEWLQKHAETFNYTLYPEDNTIVFGDIPA